MGIVKNMMLFCMTCILSTTALEFNDDFDFEVYSWDGKQRLENVNNIGIRRRLQSLELWETFEDEETLNKTGLRRRLQVEDEETFKNTGLRRRLQVKPDDSTLDESTSDKSDDWPYESDDGPEVAKFLYSIVGLLCISVIVGFIVGFWCLFLRCSKVPEPQVPEPQIVIMNV